MSPDAQEALSRRFGDDIVILLPLKSGRMAVFNAARELCGTVSLCSTSEWGTNPYIYFQNIMRVWHPPAKPPSRPDFTLEDLGL